MYVSFRTRHSGFGSIHASVQSKSPFLCRAGAAPYSASLCSGFCPRWSAQYEVRDPRQARPEAVPRSSRTRWSWTGTAAPATRL